MSPFPENGQWIRLPETEARIHRSDLKPCGLCGKTLFNIVRVGRPAGRSADGSVIWSHSISVECPSCKMVSARRDDVRRLIGRFDTSTGEVLDVTEETRNASDRSR